jgi:hypothetical protein
LIKIEAIWEMLHLTRWNAYLPRKEIPTFHWGKSNVEQEAQKLHALHVAKDGKDAVLA